MSFGFKEAKTMGLKRFLFFCLVMVLAGSGCSDDGNSQADSQVKTDGPVKTDSQVKADGPKAGDAGKDAALPDQKITAPDAATPCGNGKIDGNEKCDKGPLNSNLPDAPCRPDCTLPGCGDGVKDSGEGCDDGNNKSGDGCSSTCAVEKPAALLAQPPSLHFGAVGLGCVSSGKSLSTTLHNPSSAGIKVSSVVLSGCTSEFVNLAVPPGTIPAKGTLKVAVSFTAATVGNKSCTLVVTAGGGQLFVPLTAQVTPKTSQKDTFLQTMNRKVDVLFAIDSTGSMQNEMSDIEKAIPDFINEAMTWKLDFHIGVIPVAKYSSGPYTPGALHGKTPYVTTTTKDAMKVMKDNAKVPSCMGDEKSFDSIIAALSAPLTGVINASSCTGCAAPNYCSGSACVGPNWGFRRNDASLEILTFTDEDDDSVATPAITLTFLQGLVNPVLGQFVRVHAMVPQSCGSTTSYPNFKSLVNSTGGQLSDLCTGKITAAVKALANRMFALQDQFFLSRLADKTTLKVKVDNAATTAYTYDAVSNSITFTTAPKDKSVITVEYTAKCK